MTKTLEMRWFFKGAISNDILLFFKDRKIIFQEETSRTDWYLLKVGKEVSIKVRNGNLEIKQLIEATGNIFSVSEIQGNAGIWSKYSLALKEEGESATITGGGSRNWIAVTKNRSIAKYEIKNDDTVVAIPADMHTDDGCSLEICSVQVRGLIFWTMCLEATGSENKIGNNLDVVIRHLFRESGLSLFKKENSYGYPEFLAKLSLL